MKTKSFFNSHDLIKKLIAKKIQPSHAEAMVELFMDIKKGDYEQLASKDDLALLAIDIKQQLQIFKQEFCELELRMIIKLGAMMATLLGIMKYVF
jgi:hypothetical protein